MLNSSLTVAFSQISSVSFIMQKVCMFVMHRCLSWYLNICNLKDPLAWFCYVLIVRVHPPDQRQMRDLTEKYLTDGLTGKVTARPEYQQRTLSCSA